MKNRVVKKTSIRKIPLISAIAISVASITGCQTINVNDTVSNEMTQVSQAETAKKRLEKVLTKQMMSSFIYNTSVEVSNAKRLETLKNQISTESTSIENVAEACDTNHDIAYIELLKKAEQAGTDVYSNVYDVEREALRISYLQCDEKYQQLKEESYTSTSEVVDYLSDSDNNYTENDVKRATLQNNYLFKPLSMNITGSYQPLIGKVSFLPTVSFNQRNLYAKVQQPIYIDVKNGDLYLWAETFAPLISGFVDDELGLSWKDKWIRATLSDGSLPEDIIKNLTDSLIKAQVTAYEQEPVEGFGFVDVDDIDTTLPYLQASHAKTIKSSNQIISRVHDNSVNKRQRYLFQRAFYETLNKAQPELFTNDAVNNVESKKVLTSKKMLNIMLNVLKKTITSYEANNNDAENDVYAEDADTTRFEYFGLKGNKLAWWHMRSIGTQAKTEGIHLDMLTQFDSINPVIAQPLKNLSLPNVDNSINLLDYSEELLEKYDNDNDSIVGKTITEILDSDANTEESDLLEVFGGVEDAEAMVDKHTEISVSSSFQAKQCVVMSVSIETMCEADSISNEKELLACQKEKKEVMEVYDEYCQ